MRRFVWTSDLHLDRLSRSDFWEFKNWLLEQQSDALVLSGDIAEADSFAGYLRDLADILPGPIYFVLGNHDYWGSSFSEVHAAAGRLVPECTNVHWLSASGLVVLNPTTCMIGHDGWSDGRTGSFAPGDPAPRDFIRITDLALLSRAEYLPELNRLGDEAAGKIRHALLDAAAAYRRVYLVTHVPPFREACRDSSGRVFSDKKLPFYTCKALGDILLEIMAANPQCELTVLCGHSHDECDYRPAANIRVLVRNSGYGNWYTPTIVDLEDPS